MSKFVLANKNQAVCFLYESECFSGVKKIADLVRRDINLVVDKYPKVNEVSNGELPYDLSGSLVVIFGVVGQSVLLDKLSRNNKINCDNVIGKHEVYSFCIVDEPFEGIEKALVIAGSDKRGAIYGLFHISDLIGVSPFVDWSDVKPQKQSEIIFDDDVCFVSKEPSVKYRGFFINDEWPAFGTFCEKHFGGMNAKVYDIIFQLMLRLKGNYLWPAMWSACFAVDGPGLASAELADEYGIVMGLSHHEPCLRHGEEYSKLRGKDSPYGDAWNFRKNREGIIRFWRDGLKRNGHLENIITLGMRGERDSAIMGKEATLADNIELVRDVINTQNQLIKEEVNPNIEEVPRLLALYKEVEPFFYGDATTKGLMGDPCLSDVILLLCDDNHGYLRSRPDEKMLEHKGGYGLYYHFDYHGEPVSYEWVNSSYLPQVWEQLTEAYETGIRELWIVNVGDLGFQEFPLSYFMELAYDYDTWGISAPNKTDDYTSMWIEKQFSSDFSAEEKDMLLDLMKQFTRLNHNRRPEHMSEYIYHPVHNNEAEKIYNQAVKLNQMVEKLEQSCKNNYNAFQQLVAYQIKAALNYICMCLFRGWNHFAAKKGLVIANTFADKIRECLDIDEKLRDDFHKLNDSKWDGLASASHIGFCNWNDEEAQNPIIETVIPVKKSRVAVGVCTSEMSTCGEEWTQKRLYLKDFLNPSVKEADIYVGLCSEQAVDFTVVCDDERIVLSMTDGTVDADNPIVRVHVSVNCKDNVDGNPVIYVKTHTACAVIEVLMPNMNVFKADTFVDINGVVCMHAENYSALFEQEKEYFEILNDIGKVSSGVKLYTENKALDKENPSWLAYDFYVEEGGAYVLTLETEPANARVFCQNIEIGYSINEEPMETLLALPKGYEPGVTRDWEEGVLSHVREIKSNIICKAGNNRIYYYALSGENVLERIILAKKDKKIPESYLGPGESK